MRRAYLPPKRVEVLRRRRWLHHHEVGLRHDRGSRAAAHVTNPVSPVHLAARPEIRFDVVPHPTLCGISAVRILALSERVHLRFTLGVVSRQDGANVFQFHEIILVRPERVECALGEREIGRGVPRERVGVVVRRREPTFGACCGVIRALTLIPVR